jgi:hypothetical protein
VATLVALRALPHVGDARDVAARVGVLLVAAAVALWFRRRPLRFGLGVAVVLMGGFSSFRLPGTVAMTRSYYGSYRVTRPPGTRRHLMFHGTTVHGAQDRGAPAAAPISYFHPASPAARLVRDHLPADGRLAVVGLGVGSLAAYLQPGQTLRYFELDPLVRELASDPRYFTHLRDTRGAVDVVVGDGRLSLVRDAGPRYQLVFLDAFTSDAVPVHLLTREAVAHYLTRLAPGGALVFNTSNRHVRLDALVAALARDLGLPARAHVPPPLSPTEEAAGWARTTWAVLTRDEVELERWAPLEEGWRTLTADPEIRAWTDARASLLSVIRW